MTEPVQQRDEPAHAQLEQLGREGEDIGGRRLPQTEPDAVPASNDRIEIWGRRIGHGLGWAAVIFLLLQLIRVYGQ
jgi:hypothetical protein